MSDPQPPLGDAAGRDQIDLSIHVGNVSGTGIAIGHGAVANVTLVPPPPPTPRQIPPAPPDLLGREKELADLLAQFDQGETAASGLRGQGGLGKTALALKLAEALAPRFPDGQLFVDLRGATASPRPPVDAMGLMIHAYRPLEQLPGAESDVRALYHSVLAGRRTLLLLDDAAGREQVMPLIPPKGCGLLITSRQTFALPGVHLVPLDTLQPDDAVRLLTLIALGESNVGAKPSPLQEIAELCGYLPLALRAAGGQLAETVDLSPVDFVRALRNERARLALAGPKAEGAEISVEASFNLSYDHLPAEAQAVFAALAVFPDNFDAQAEEAVCQDPAHRHLSNLLKRSLVGFTPSPSREGGAGGDGGRYHLHPLARDYAASRLPESAHAQAARRHALHYLQVLTTAGNLYGEGHEGVSRGLALFDEERSNIFVGQAWTTAEFAAADQTLKASADEIAQACNLYGGHGSLLLLRLHPRENIHWIEAGLAAARRLKDRQSETIHLGNLGNAYFAIGQTHQAIDYYEQDLAIAREICAASPEHSAEWMGARQSEGCALGNLGNAYYALGDARRAIDYYEQDLAIAREIRAAFPEGSAEWTAACRGEGDTLGNLGNAYSAIGQTHQAIDYYEQDLAIARENGDHLGEGASLGNLGTAYFTLGQPRRAMEHYEQALTIHRKLGDRRGEGDTLGNLGNVDADLGEPHRAVEWHTQHLAIAREIGHRQGEGAALGGLGVAYVKLGAPHQALDFFEQWLAIARELGDRRGECQALGNLGNVYLALDEPSQAIEYYEQDLALVREIGDRQGESAALSGLGLAYGKLGAPRQALNFFEQWLATARNLHNRHSEGQALGQLGLAYSNLGQLRQAIDCYEQRLTIARELGDRHGEAAALGNLGAVYRILGQPRRAIEYHEQTLPIDRELGDQQGESATLNNLGNAYADLSELRRAIDFYTQYLALAHETGDRSGESQAIGSLGNAYLALDETPKAIDCFEQHLALARELGDRRGEGNALGNLGVACLALGQTQRASDYYAQHLALARELRAASPERSAEWATAGLSEGIALWGLALCSQKAGDLPQALAQAEAARDIFATLESPHASNLQRLLDQWHEPAEE